MNVKIIEFVGLIVIVLCLVLSGWTVRGWYEGKQQQARADLAAKVTKTIQQSEANTAKLVEDKLSKLSSGERVIKHETIKVLQSPVYNIDCLDDAGLQLIELAKRQYTDTRKSTNEVPTGHTDTSGKDR